MVRVPTSAPCTSPSFGVGAAVSIRTWLVDSTPCAPDAGSLAAGKAAPKRLELLVAVELDRQPTTLLEPGEHDLRAQRAAKLLLDRPRLGIGRYDPPRRPRARLGGAGPRPLFRLAHAPVLANDPLQADQLLGGAG